MSKVQIDFTNGSIFSKLVLFAVPLILSSVLQLLFNAADIVVVGNFAGDHCLAAVGSTASLVNLLVNIFIGLSVGTTVTAANFFGARDSKSLQQTVHCSMLVSVYSGLVLTVVGVFGSKYFLSWMQAPEEVLPLATLYLQIFFAGSVAGMVYNFGSAILRAKGDTVRPLVILTIAGFLNVALNLLFVIKFDMNVAGVAWATVISQCFSAVMVVIVLIRETDDFHLDVRKLKLDREILIRIAKIGIPAGFQGIMFSFSNVIIQSSVNSFGAVAVAGNSAAGTIEGFVWTSMNGVSQATLTFAGQNLGARRFDRISRVGWISQFFVTGVGLVLGCLVVVLGRQLLGFFSPTPEVQDYGMLRLKTICIPYFLCGIMDCMAALIRGVGHSVLPMIVTLIGACGLRLVWIFTVFQIPKFHTLFTIYLSYGISWIVTWAVLLICFLVIYKKIVKDININ
ncbi:MAG: MATE family efflux transporter [Treponema sp.]|nr:MATE family efflux transporter [Treponema sp.]